MLSGSENRGVTDREFLHLLRAAARAIKPAAGRRRLTIFSHLEGGRLGGGGFSDARHKYVLCIQVRAFEGTLSFRGAEASVGSYLSLRTMLLEGRGRPGFGYAQVLGEELVVDEGLRHPRHRPRHRALHDPRIASTHETISSVRNVSRH